jgi:hypothetical protein
MRQFHLGPQRNLHEMHNLRIDQRLLLGSRFSGGAASTTVA